MILPQAFLDCGGENLEDCPYRIKGQSLQNQRTVLYEEKGT